MENSAFFVKNNSVRGRRLAKLTVYQAHRCNIPNMQLTMCTPRNKRATFNSRNNRQPNPFYVLLRATKESNTWRPYFSDSTFCNFCHSSSLAACTFRNSSFSFSTTEDCRAATECFRTSISSCASVYKKSIQKLKSFLGQGRFSPIYWGVGSRKSAPSMN